MTHLLPQAARLIARLRALETPLVQVWGWPGSGRSSLLCAFLEHQGAAADGLSLGVLATSGRAAVESAASRGVRWLVVPGDPGDGVVDVAQWLRPGQQLVFAGEHRCAHPALGVSFLAPQELLLTAAEVAALWELVTGESPSPSAVRRLWEATDGWYRPLRLALEATGGAGLEAVTPEQLLDIAPVRHFLRHEVLSGLGEGIPPVGRGLWVEGTAGDRVPRLLAAGLERDRRHREPAAARHTAPAVPAEAGKTRPAYVLSLLGAPSARQRGPRGEVEIECRLRRSFQVLAYLASSPGLEATREELIEAIWPADGEQTIDRNFHPTLSHLRRALEGGRGKEEMPSLLFRSGIYRLNPDFAWEVDAHDLVRRVEEGKLEKARGDLAAAEERWRGAWSLYRGPFLQGHYEAWVAARREGYQKVYLELLRNLGELYQRLERVEEAVDACRAVLVEDPLQERVHLSLMQLYARQGRRDMVRRQYDRLCTLLLDELGVEPLPATTREFHRLMG
ncbi:MAG TPA: hypothetical protein DD490_00830 [Acidobacteria bacterium]|nr:hypothetical protein [Acidobacteriota bacterium]